MELETQDNEKRIMVVAGIIGAGIIMAGIALGDAAILGNLIIIAAFLVAVPYFFFKYTKYIWVKSLENPFPSFIRDLADSVRSMPLPEALGVVSKSNYGNLTPEIEKIHNRMSWGTPFLRAIDIFEKKVKDSRIISEALGILKQSFEAGGEIASTLESISRDLLMLRETEAERSSLLRQHIMIMYAIFFMFVGIAVLIIFVMVPMIENQGLIGGGGFQLSSPVQFTNPCVDMNIPFPCYFYMGIATLFGVPFEKIGAYYVALFFSSIIVQGIFIGLITGQLGNNSVFSGIKHSLIMVFTSIAIFLFLSNTGIMPI